MFEVVLVASVTLAIVLYGQARLAAREIRRNRENLDPPTCEPLLFSSQDS